MKILADRDCLIDALGRVAPAIPARSPKPILQNAKLVASAEGATLMATDLEVGIRVKVLGVKVLEPGPIVLPMPKGLMVLRSLTGDDELAIEEDGEVLRIRGHRSDFKLPLEDPGLFPDPPEFGGEGIYGVDPKALRAGIRRTIFATDPDSTRYALSGVQFAPKGGDLILAGTDGRRLATQEVPFERDEPADMVGGFPVVPAKALKLIDRNLDDDEPAALAIDAGKAVLVRSGRAVVWTRVVEGRFPKYEAIIPGRPRAVIPLPVAELLSAVSQASIVTSKESRGVDFAFGGGLLKLASQTADVGESHVELPIDFDGEEVALTFDASYLLEALKVLEPSSTMTAELIDGKSAAVFRTDDGYTYVVMPLNRDG